MTTSQITGSAELEFIGRSHLYALKDDEGNLTVRFLLITIVIRPDPSHLRPKRFTFRGSRSPCRGVEYICHHLDFYLGMLKEIEVPLRMLWGATFGCYDDIAIPSFAVDKCESAWLS